MIEPDLAEAFKPRRFPSGKSLIALGSAVVGVLLILVRFGFFDEDRSSHLPRETVAFLSCGILGGLAIAYYVVLAVALRRVRRESKVVSGTHPDAAVLIARQSKALKAAFAQLDLATQSLRMFFALSFHRDGLRIWLSPESAVFIAANRISSITAEDETEYRQTFRVFRFMVQDITLNIDVFEDRFGELERPSDERGRRMVEAVKALWRPS